MRASSLRHERHAIPDAACLCGEIVLGARRDVVDNDPPGMECDSLDVTSFVEADIGNVGLKLVCSRKRGAGAENRLPDSGLGTLQDVRRLERDAQMTGSRLLHELPTYSRRVRPGHGELDVVAVILLELDAGEARALDPPLLEDRLPGRGHVAEDC